MHDGFGRGTDVETQLKYVPKYVTCANCLYCFKSFRGVYLEFASDAEFNCVVATDVNAYIKYASEFARRPDFVAYLKYFPPAHAVARSGAH